MLCWDTAQKTWFPEDLDDVDRETGLRITAPMAYCESLLVLAFHLIVAQILGWNWSAEINGGKMWEYCGI